MASDVTEERDNRIHILPVLCSKVETTMINTSTRKPCKMYSSSLLDIEMQLTGENQSLAYAQKMSERMEDNQ